MSDNEDSKKISKYNELVVKKYKEFVGENELRQLLKRFTPEKFAGIWKQAMCSSSTRFLGSGPNYSSVQAKYTLKENNIVGVRNDSYDNDFRKAGITGTSGARDVSVPTCRTVKFNNIFDIEGDYWLIYATPSFQSVIVSAPIILKVFNRPLVIANNFGFYVLTRNIKKFWSSPEEHEAIFDVLKKYKFRNFWNKPVATAETYEIYTSC